MSASTTGGSAASEVLDSPRRLSLSHIVEMLLRPRAVTQTINLRTLAKGEVRPDMQVVQREDESDEAFVMRASRLFNALYAEHVTDTKANGAGE